MTTIGVTGHRILTDLERIHDGLDEVVAHLDTIYPGPWTVVSALAEGADRLVARRLLERIGTTLVALLPLPIDDYESDFTTPGSRQEFRSLLDRADEVVVVGPEETRDAAYERAGVAVLARSDVLVAVWDGANAQGRGGTGEIVAAARQRDLPVVWVHAGNRRPGTADATSLGRRQGRVTFERLPPS